MGEPVADLHLHSTFSDGSEAPAAAVAAAAASGATAVALADHGTGAGIGEAFRAALAAGVVLVPAVEVAVADREGLAHVLAYGCDSPPEGARAPADEAAGCPLGDGAVRTAPRLSLPAAAEAIRREGGVPVLAHPAHGIAPGRLAARLAAASEGGALGVEAWHPAHDAATADRIARAAARFGLLATGGSDRHGPGRVHGPGPPAMGAAPAAAAPSVRALLSRLLAGPLLVAVGGPVGSGKSTAARRLVSLLSADHLSSDALREEMFPRAEVGPEAKYASRSSDAVFRVLFLRTEETLRRGRAVVLDATLRHAEGHRVLAGIANRTGARLALLDCACEEAALRARLTNRVPGADHASEAGPEILDLMRARAAEAPADYGPFSATPEARARADALLRCDSTPGIAPDVRVRVSGPLSPLAVLLGTALGAGESP
ncbi:MAG: AAA family ATPase [Planctomycetales bacterium]|nr:AAA family ATPase [Planctomycetales bacterium]